jgi:serine protease Do
MNVLKLFQALLCLFALDQSVSRACHASELKVVDDPSTGVRVSLPVDLLSASTETAIGRNWTTTDRDFNVDTIKFPADQTLESAFLKLSGLRGRAVSRAERSSEGFVLVGHDADGSSFYLAVQRKDDVLRGLSIVCGR